MRRRPDSHIEINHKKLDCVWKLLVEFSIKIHCLFFYSNLLNGGQQHNDRQKDAYQNIQPYSVCI